MYLAVRVMKNFLFCPISRPFWLKCLGIRLSNNLFKKDWYLLYLLLMNSRKPHTIKKAHSTKRFNRNVLSFASCIFHSAIFRYSYKGNFKIKEAHILPLMIDFLFWEHHIALFTLSFFWIQKPSVFVGY